MPDNIRNDPEITSDQRMREVLVKEVFPNYSLAQNEARNLAMFDLAYYPSEPGPYNFDVEGAPGISAGLDADGALNDPSSRWAGIMRPLQINNFEEQNIEFIQFWVMDPFYENDNAPDGGDLYFNLGSVGEDILKDGRQSFENGIPATGDKSSMDSTQWGYLSEVQPITEFFDNAAGAREVQDVGFDALMDGEERTGLRQDPRAIWIALALLTVRIQQPIRRPTATHPETTSNFTGAIASMLRMPTSWSGTVLSTVHKETAPRSP